MPTFSPSCKDTCHSTHLGSAARPRVTRSWAAFDGEPADKNWSLTDCISFVVMKEWELSEALTADRHFEQAGFKALFLA